MTRTVLITGASRGIGRAVAEEYKANGWIVVAPNRSECDLQSASAIDALLRKTGIEFDSLINNAGENRISLIEDMKVDDWNAHLAVNLTAPMILSRAISESMRAKRWGRIVNVASIFGHVSRGGRGAYAASKSGLLGFTRTAAIEWGADNVLVNAICPGYIRTDLTDANNTPAQIAELVKSLPMRRLGRPDEVAKAIYFLGSEFNSFITGQSLLIDGGFTAL